MVAFSMTVDLSAGPAELQRAQRVLDLLAEVLSRLPEVEGSSHPAWSGTAAGLAVRDDRRVLSGEELREFLTARAVQERSPLNDGERTMLAAIAARAPLPLPYGDNAGLLGGGRKFGNVSSGLARRFWNRGAELPYAPDPSNTGYAMSEANAQVVLQVLAETEPAPAS